MYPRFPIFTLGLLNFISQIAALLVVNSMFQKLDVYISGRSLNNAKEIKEWGCGFACMHGTAVVFNHQLTAVSTQFHLSFFFYKDTA